MNREEIVSSDFTSTVYKVPDVFEDRPCVSTCRLPCFLEEGSVDVGPNCSQHEGQK